MSPAVAALLLGPSQRAQPLPSPGPSWKPQHKPVPGASPEALGQMALASARPRHRHLAARRIAQTGQGAQCVWGE